MAKPTMSTFLRNKNMKRRLIVVVKLPQTPEVTLKTLNQRVKSGRVRDMGVVSQSYGGWCGGGDGDGGWQVCGTEPGWIIC